MAKHDTIMEKIVSYDKDNDILVIHKGFTASEKFKGNIDIGDIALDMSTTGKVRGIEIFNASQVLRPFGEDKSLEHLRDADFQARVHPNGITISLTIKSKKSEFPATIVVPLDHITI